MTPIQKATVALGVAAAAAIALLTRKAKAGPKGGDCAPYKWDPDAANALIDEQITAGVSSPEQIAIAVATQLYGHHPSGRTVGFPPAQDAIAGVKCVYERILGMARTAVGNMPHWKDLVDQWTAPMGDPEAGKFYKQSQGEIFYGENGIISKILDRAGVPNTGTNRANYLHAMECSPFNDAVYNSDLDATGLRNRARTFWPRGVVQNPQYVDNYLRSAQGMPWKRGRGSSYAMAWWPLIEASGDGRFIISTWADGSSAINPPTELLALGFEDVPRKQYGCGSDKYAGSKQTLP